MKAIVPEVDVDSKVHRHLHQPAFVSDLASRRLHTLLSTSNNWEGSLDYDSISTSRKSKCNHCN